MRLLNVKTMNLEEFSGLQIPKYAILSHCWGIGEVTFQDIQHVGRSRWHLMAGATKIRYATAESSRHDLNYVWIDTCCIDKSSSAELSEAINSMYSWYEESEICFAYLEDVTSVQSSIAGLGHSRWFTRGWTLQEMIAPAKIDFYGKSWMFLGNKIGLSSALSSITSIPEDILIDPSRRSLASVARKMSWAAGRKTSRVEDTAYSLLGIFKVNMPLLYGEGEKAFIRLQEEIIRETDDQSLFAWGVMHRYDRYLMYSDGVLAESPAAFKGSENIVPIRSIAGRRPYSMTNRGLRIELPLLMPESTNFAVYPIAMLDCQFENDFSGSLGIALRSTSNSSEFTRQGGCGVRKYSPVQTENAPVRIIYIGKNLKVHQPETLCCIVRSDSIQDHGYHIAQVAPRKFLWNKDTRTLQMAFHEQTNKLIGAAFEFDNPEGHLRNFIIIIAFQPGIRDHKRRSLIKILVKPAEVMLEQFFEKCRTSREAYFLGDLHGYDRFRVRSARINDAQFEVSARVIEEEILNQTVLVLELDLQIVVVG
jgi:Heterokaryon incompatibility protein (HET)